MRTELAGTRPLLEETDEDAVAMTTLDGDERSPNGTTNLFDVTMDDAAAAATTAGCVRLVHIHKNDDEPMVSVYDTIVTTTAFSHNTPLECK